LKEIFILGKTYFSFSKKRLSLPSYCIVKNHGFVVAHP